MISRIYSIFDWKKYINTRESRFDAQNTMMPRHPTKWLNWIAVFIHFQCRIHHSLLSSVKKEPENDLAAEIQTSSFLGCFYRWYQLTDTKWQKGYFIHSEWHIFNTIQCMNWLFVFAAGPVSNLDFQFVLRRYRL